VKEKGINQMKVTISLFSKGQEHAYKYELDLDEAHSYPVQLPSVVSPSNDVNRVFVRSSLLGAKVFPATVPENEYHEATYDFCTMIHEAPDQVRIAAAKAPLLGDKIPVWTPPEE
jgi:hypothetical protein